MAAYTQHDSQFFSRRAITFTVAVGVQALIVWLFSSGLATRVMNIVAPPIQTNIVQQVQKKEAPPPPPPPKMEQPPVQVPPPAVSINLPAETNSTAITNVTTKPVPKAPPPPPPRKVVMTRVGVTGRNFPNVNDFYPPASQRLNEEGTADVHVCVGPDGRLTQQPSIAKTSGHSRLDEAAIRLAKAGSGRYTPATADGKPVNGCTTFAVRFQLQ